MSVQPKIGPGDLVASARASPASPLGPAGDPAWTEACIAAFDLDARRISVDGAAADLALTRGRLELIGPAQLFEPGDLRWHDERDLSDLVARLRETKRPLALHRVPRGSPTIAALRERLPLVLERAAGSCPVIHVDGDPEAALSARRRADLRRARRRADSHGAMSAAVHEPDAHEADGLLDLAFAIEARSWKGPAGSALVHDPVRARFYRLYGRAAAAAGELRIAILSIAGHEAAMQIAIERDEALWLLKIGYDERLAAASPGQLLMLATLRWAAARGLQRYEFLGTAAPWTRTWTRVERPCSSAFAYPPSRRGAAALSADAARHLVRRARR